MPGLSWVLISSCDQHLIPVREWLLPYGPVESLDPSVAEAYARAHRKPGQRVLQMQPIGFAS